MDSLHWKSQLGKMSLIPSFSLLEFVATIPFVVVLAPFVMPSLKAILENPLVSSAINSISVMLNNTEMVWRPAFQQGFKVLKLVVFTGFNLTMSAIQTVQQMGVSLTTAFPSILVRLGEVGEALVVVARALGNVLYYGIRALSLVVGSAEKVFVFGKHLLFEAHLLSFDDFMNITFPFFVVLSTVAFLYWLRKTPQPSAVKNAEPFQPRRSSRLARKRAMLYASDMSDALSPCKKPSATATNL